MHLARGRSVAFTGAVALTNNGHTVRMNGDPHPGDIDRQECASIFAGKNAFGFDGFPVPAVKAEDPVGLRDGVPAFEIGQLPAMGLPGPDVGAVRLTPQRLQLFCREAHHRVLTLRTGSGLERVAPGDLGAAFEVARQDLASQARLAWLPIGLGHGILVEHHQGGHSGPNRRGKIGSRQFLQVQLEHRILSDLTPLSGPILQPVEPVLHVGDPAFEPCGHCLVGQGGADNRGEDFVQVGEPLNGIGEGLLVDLGVLGFDAVADGAVGGGGKR